MDLFDQVDGDPGDDLLAEKIPIDILAGVNAAIKTARMILENLGEILPIALMMGHEHDDAVLIPLSEYFETNEKKDRAVELIRFASRESNAQAVLIISEGWGAIYNQNLGLLIPPSADPDRVEVVTFFLSTPFGDYGGTAQLLRPEGKPPTFHRVRWTKQGDVTGRFTRLVEQEESHE